MHMLFVIIIVCLISCKTILYAVDFLKPFFVGWKMFVFTTMLIKATLANYRHLLAYVYSKEESYFNTCPVTLHKQQMH